MVSVTPRLRAIALLSIAIAVGAVAWMTMARPREAAQLTCGSCDARHVDMVERRAKLAAAEAGNGATKPP